MLLTQKIDFELFLSFRSSKKFWTSEPVSFSVNKILYKITMQLTGSASMFYITYKQNVDFRKKAWSDSLACIHECWLASSLYMVFLC